MGGVYARVYVCGTHLVYSLRPFTNHAAFLYIDILSSDIGSLLHSVGLSSKFSLDLKEQYMISLITAGANP